MWKLKSLEGQKVLINIWATYLVRTLHSRAAASGEVIRTDQEPLRHQDNHFEFRSGCRNGGAFRQEEGLRISCAAGYSFLANKIDVNSIPRNWLVNANGKWQWEQIGFDSSEPDWEKSMLARLEGTK